MTKKITLLDSYTVNADKEFLNELGKFGSVTSFKELAANEIAHTVKDSHIVLTDHSKIDKTIIYNCPNLEYIGVMATGFDSVDIDAAKEKNIAVTNIPSYGSDAVAQHTVAMLLHITNHLDKHQIISKRDYWDYPHIELKGKTLGVIGYGDIAKRVIEMVSGFGVSVKVCTRYPDLNNSNPNIEFISFDDLIEVSDIITIHRALTEDSKNLINKETINKMKDGAILINAARGGLVDEDALAEALETGKIYAAGLDVQKKEPLRKDEPLLKYENCILTPHIAFAGKDALAKLRFCVLENIESFYNNTDLNRII